MADEIGWLIEYVKLDGPWYWSRQESFYPPRHLTKDASLAVRFARKIDAEAVIKQQRLHETVAVEYMWCETSNG